MMTDSGFVVVGAARPVITGHVLAISIGRSVGLRAGENVMPVGRITAAGYGSTSLVDRSISAHPVEHGVKLIHVRCNAVAIGIEPGARSDSVPSIYGTIALCAEVGTPGGIAPVDTFRQALADGIGSLKSPQVSAIAGTCAGQKK